MNPPESGCAPNLTAFIDRERRLPRLGDPVSPWHYRGWLLPYGLALFAPPNVKGWSEGKAWLNTATLLARNSFALRISSGNGTRKPAKAPRMPNPDVAEVLRTEKITEPLQAIDLLLDIYLQGEVGKTMRAKLVAFLADGNPKGDAFYARARQVVTVILSLPEYQLA